MKKLDIRTYEDYISLKKNPTKPFLMISELIDNSISSFDNHYGEEEWGEVLDIYIDFYFDKNNTKFIHDTKTQTNSYIRVTDNAFGMDQERLIEAIRLNKKNETSVSKMNRHGRGLKQCAFYFGADLEIETWNHKDEISTISLKTSLFNSGDEVELESFRIDESELEDLESRGTSITVKKIYANKALSQSKFESIINAISFRYIKLIENGRMNIRYNDDIFNQYSTSKKKEEVQEPIEKVKTQFNYNMKKINEIIKSSKEDIDKAKKGLIEEKGLRDFPKDKKIVDEAFENIKQLLIEGQEDEDKDFKWTQVLQINDKEMEVKFWMLKRGFSRFRGYRVYEGDRALLHPPMTDDENGTQTYYRPVFPSSNKTGSTDNRFAGEFDILDINATTSTDKSQFIFEDSEDEDVLNLKLRLIWEVFNIFVLKGRSDVTRTEGKGITKKEQNVIKSVVDSKFSTIVKDVEVDAETDGVSMNMNIAKDNKWIVKIRIDKQMKPNKIWDKQISEDENGNNEMIITSYSAHPIWQRIDQSTDFIAEALIPITIFIAHYEISNISDGTSKVNLSDIDYSKIDSPIEHLNKSGEIISE